MLTTQNIKKIVYTAFAVFIGLYVLRAFLAPLDPETLMKYDVSELKLRLIGVSFLLPVVGIWVCAAYGFVHFKQYALSIKGTAYGKGTNTVANGLGVIALQMLVSSGFTSLVSISSVKEAFGGDSGVAITSANITLVFAFAAAFVLYQGSSQLNASLAKPSRPKTITKSFYTLLLTGIAFLGAIVLRYPTDGSTESIYEYVPLGTAIIGIGIPYIIIWNFYLLAARNLHYYRHQVKGKIYQQALRLLTTGVYIILGSSVFIQLLGAFSGSLANLKLLPLLIIVYLLVAAIGVGYLYVARAATKLSRVEN